MDDIYLFIAKRTLVAPQHLLLVAKCKSVDFVNRYRCVCNVSCTVVVRALHKRSSKDKATRGTVAQFAHRKYTGSGRAVLRPDGPYTAHAYIQNNEY